MPTEFWRNFSSLEGSVHVRVLTFLFLRTFTKILGNLEHIAAVLCTCGPTGLIITAGERLGRKIRYIPFLKQPCITHKSEKSLILANIWSRARQA